MVKKIISAVICIAVLSSCNNQQNPAQQPNNMDNDSVAARVTTGALSGRYCYGYTTNKDSILLTVNITDSIVTGNLHYNLYEKDKSSGSIQGKMKGDTVIADYTFMAEGMQSVREVAFLLDDSTAKEGYGEMIEKNNKMIFLKPGKLMFDKSFVLIKKECTPEK